MKRSILALSLAFATAAAGFAGEPALKIISAGATVALTADDLKALPHVELTATDPHEKKEHLYSGVPVRDLLAKVGAPLGEKLRGKALQMAVLVRSRDGYTTLFALAEFDDAFSSRTVLLADSEDGKPLAANSAPLRLIAPGDKRAARWARMVTSMEIVSPGAAH
jgi:hypothetical protein